MEINISNLSEGTHNYTLSEKAEKLGLSEIFFGDVKAEVSLESKRRQILLHIVAEGKANFQCDRCLKNITKNIAATFYSVYEWEGERVNSEESNDNFYLLPLGTNIINISSDVNEYLALAVPYKILCKEECAGLCPQCGKDLNVEQCTCEKEIDFRWNKLREIVSNQ